MWHLKLLQYSNMEAYHILLFIGLGQNGPENIEIYKTYNNNQNEKFLEVIASFRLKASESR